MPLKECLSVLSALFSVLLFLLLLGGIFAGLRIGAELVAGWSVHWTGARAAWWHS